MKRLLTVLFLFLFVNSFATIKYMAPWGDDSNAGTYVAPFKTLEYSVTQISAGDTLYLRGGTYQVNKSASTANRIDISGLDGSASAYYKIWNYPGENPVYDFGNILCTAGGVWGFILQSSDHVWIRGIEFKNLFQNPSNNVVYGFQISGSDNCIVERVSAHNIGGSVMVNLNSDSTLWLNCDAYNSGDKFNSYNGANGFENTNNVSSGVVYNGCRAWWISDDGFDTYYNDTTTTFINCWAFFNGYVKGTFIPAGNGYGFKLGPASTDMSGSIILKRAFRCLAFGNRFGGFTQNNGQQKYQMINNTSDDNHFYGFTWIWHTSITQDFRNNAAMRNEYNNDGSPTTGTNNTWNGAVTFDVNDVVSMNYFGLTAKRGKNGELPQLNYMKLKPTSDLIDAGDSADLPLDIIYNGAAPDMGAFEYKKSKYGTTVKLN